MQGETDQDEERSKKLKCSCRYAMLWFSSLQVASKVVSDSLVIVEAMCFQRLLWEESKEAVPYQTAILVINGACVASASPVEQSSQSVLSYIVGLHPDRMRVVIRNETTIAAHAVSCTAMLVNMLLSTRARQVTVLECSFLACLTRERMANTLRSCEGSAVSRHAHANLVGWHTLLQHVRYSGMAGNRCLWAVRVLGRKKLSLVTALVDPRTGVVVGHQIDHVEVVGGLVQVDVLQRPFAGGKGR